MLKLINNYYIYIIFIIYIYIYKYYIYYIIVIYYYIYIIYYYYINIIIPIFKSVSEVSVVFSAPKLNYIPLKRK